jgi:hypothetical protein
MLHAVGQNGLVTFKDLIDDAIVATPHRPKTSEFADQRLAESVRILSKRAEVLMVTRGEVG